MRILFVPEVELVATSERTPSLYRMLMEDHEVIGLRSPMDRTLFDTSRATWPRYLLYPLYILVLASQGARVARRHHVDLVFCETANHALAGLIVAKACGFVASGTATRTSNSSPRASGRDGI